MNPPQVLAPLFIGLITGLRSLTTPAAVAWAAHLGWIHLQATPLSFMGSTAAVAIFTILAVGELIADKLPFTPSRTGWLGLGGRFTMGGLTGACLAAAAGAAGAMPDASVAASAAFASGSQAIWIGAVVGAAGGIAGAFAGYYARTGAVRALKCPDYVVALAEDAVAVGASLFIVTRF